MSIVAVHGPYTFGSKAVVANRTGSAYATVNPANGLIWTLFPEDISQPAANYDWAYTGSSTAGPASPIADTKFPAAITFSAGAHTITLTLNGVAQPSFVINAVGGVAPKMVMAGEGGEEEGGEEPEEHPEVDVAYDPSAHTVEDVLAYVEEHPEQAAEMLAVEQAGKNRVTLVTQLEEIAFDPGDHTVTEVISFVEEHPERLDDIIAAEEEDKNRVTLISHLEGMRPE